MSMHLHPAVSQVWEKDGLRRQILRIADSMGCNIRNGGEFCYCVYWTRPGRNDDRRCARNSWLRWAAGANLIEDHE
jgi:hypothetical protein